MSILALLATGAGTPIDPEPTESRRQIATRTGVSTFTMSPVSGNVGKTDRIRHHIPVGGTSPCVSFNNVTGQGVGSNDLTVAAAIEVTGTVHPFTFGGLARITLAPGDAVTSDPIEGLTVPTGYVYTRTYAEVPDTGDLFPESKGIYLFNPSSEGSSRSTGTDLTTSGSGAVPVGSVNGMPPLALSAIVSPSTPALAIIGDSISQSEHDDFQTDPTHSGFAVRGAVAADVAYINYGRGGDKAELMNNPTRRGYWFEAIDTCTHALCGYAINDLAGTRTLAQLQADSLSLWTYLDSAGLTVRQATCTPYTTSSDSFATTANQTAVMTTGETRRLDWNAWLRDGAPILSGAAVVTGSSAPGTLRAGDVGHPLDGVCDTAAEVETVSGKWNASTTGEGLHPNPAGHALMAAAVEDWLNALP